MLLLLMLLLLLMQMPLWAAGDDDDDPLFLQSARQSATDVSIASLHKARRLYTGPAASIPYGRQSAVAAAGRPNLPSAFSAFCSRPNRSRNDSESSAKRAFMVSIS